MLTRQLPAYVEPYRLAANHECLEGLLSLEKLARLALEIGEQEGNAVVKLEFSIDQQRRYLINGELQAELNIPCRRCLQPIATTVSSDFFLAIVSSDEKASDVPKEYEPVLVENEQLDLLSALEDELLLSLPQVVYHEEGQCAVSRDELTSGEPVDESPVTQEKSPFDALNALKGKLNP